MTIGVFIEGNPLALVQSEADNKEPVFAARRFHKRKREDVKDEEYVPLWLLTFADVMALMLTFFVLLYSMSTLDPEQWEDMSTAVNMGVGESLGANFKSGQNETVEITRMNTRKALPISYLETLVVNAAQDKDILNDATIKQVNDDSLVISLPGDMVFSQGGVSLNADGKRAIYALAPILGRIRNHIEIIGHADPTPIGDNAYTSNRALSLARAMSVADAFRQSGYDQTITIKGLSDSRYGELPGTIPEAIRMDIARRVDIVILKNDPVAMNSLDVQ